MKITLHIIRESLGEEVIKAQIRADRSEGVLETVSIFDPELATSPDRVYIVEKKHFPCFQTVRYKGAFIFLGGEKEEYLTEVQNDYLLLRESNTVLVLQRMQLLFEKYHNWEIELYQTASHKNSLKNIAMTAIPLIHNPFFLYTSSLKLVFCCNLTEKAERFFQTLEDFDVQVEGEYVTDGFLDRLKEDSERWQMTLKREPEINPGENLGYRTLYYNIFLGGIYAARLLICEAETKLSAGDFFVLKTLGDFLTTYLGKQDMSVNAHPVNFDKYIQKLLAGDMIDETSLKPVLQAFGWRSDDRYFCCYIPIDTEFQTTDVVMLTCVFLENTCPHSAVINFNDHIIHIINLTAMHSNRKLVQQTLVRLYRERRLKAGSSLDFMGIRQIHDRCRQAEAACILGTKTDPKANYYFYEDYDLRDLFRIIMEQYSLDSICPEEIMKLKEYDQINHMQLTRTLKTYLENDRNIAKSIRVLYMQRATFLYQLKRITEITGLNLDEYSCRLYLQLYFAAEDAADTLTNNCERKK